MEMDVEDFLTGVFFCVEDNPVSPVFNAVFFGDFSRFKKYMADHVLRILLKRVERCGVLFWDKQDMERSLRIDVFKSENKFVFVDDLGWNFFVYDFAKKAVLHIKESSSLVSDSFHVRSQGFEFFFDFLISPCEMFGVENDGFSICNETGQHKRG